MSGHFTTSLVSVSLSFITLVVRTRMLMFVICTSTSHVGVLFSVYFAKDRREPSFSSCNFGLLRAYKDSVSSFDVSRCIIGLTEKHSKKCLILFERHFVCYPFQVCKLVNDLEFFKIFRKFSFPALLAYQVFWSSGEQDWTDAHCLGCFPTTGNASDLIIIQK